MGERAADLAGADESDLLRAMRVSLGVEEGASLEKRWRCLTSNWVSYQAKKRLKPQGLESVGDKLSATLNGFKIVSLFTADFRRGST